MCKHIWRGVWGGAAGFRRPALPAHPLESNLKRLRRACLAQAFCRWIIETARQRRERLARSQRRSHKRAQIQTGCVARPPCMLRRTRRRYRGAVEPARQAKIRPCCPVVEQLPGSAGQRQALPVRTREKQCEAGMEGIGRSDREGVARILDIRCKGLRHISCSVLIFTGSANSTFNSGRPTAELYFCI